MNSETATSELNSDNKRARTDDTPSSPPTQHNLRIATLSPTYQENTPQKCALIKVATFAKSLRKYLAPIVLLAGETHIDLLHKLCTKASLFESGEWIVLN